MNKQNVCSTPKVVNFYTRYSSDNQKESSIEYQVADCEKWCAERGYTVGKIYADRGYTGTNDRRPDLQRMVKEMRSGKAECDILLVYDYSRLSRNVKDAFYYLKIFRNCRVDFISVTEPIDYTSDFAIINQFFIIAKNAQDSIDTGRRVMSHNRKIAKDSKHCGGKPPLGYRVAETGLFEIVPEEAKLVKLIFSLTLQGRSYKWMAKYLNDNGYKTKIGAPFTRNSFISILRQEKYVGTYIWNRVVSKDELGHRNTHKAKPREERTVNDGGCPQIISEKQFDAVQKFLDSRAGGKAESKSRRYYML